MTGTQAGVQCTYSSCVKAEAMAVYNIRENYCSDRMANQK